MTKLKKFLFDVDFKKTEDEKIISTKNEPTLDPDQIPIFSRAEVNNYREEHEKIGFEKGFNKGKEDALNNINNNLLNIFTKLKNDLNALEDIYEKRFLDINKRTANISLEIANKLSSAVRNIHPQENILSFLREVSKKYSDILSNEKIKIHINDGMLPAVKLYTNENSEFFNRNLNFELHGDKELDINDCRLDWESGGIEIKFKDIEEEVNKKIEDFIFSIEKDVNLKPLKEDTGISEGDKQKISEDSEEEEKEQENTLEKEDAKDDSIKNVGGSKSVKYE